MDTVDVAIIGTALALKILLIPAYRSTDFEVHRNWLAITHSLPWSQWYSDGASPSEWTLDYPPVFALFEKVLSTIAAYCCCEQSDHEVERGYCPMLDTDNLEYASSMTIIFQRTSVIISELILLLIPIALGLIVIAWEEKDNGSEERMLEVKNRKRLALFLIALHPGLLIVDHIHFQYNGVLIGLFLLSISAIERNRNILGAFLFSLLLCSKHIFLYSAPAFFVFLLRHYCRGPEAIRRFIYLGTVALMPIIVSLGPFIKIDQFPQVMGRLFPVQRGLLHAYWAPNFWALYAFADKFLLFCIKICINLASSAIYFGKNYLENFKYSIPSSLTTSFNFFGNILMERYSQASQANLTGGLIGEARFSILPQIGPKGAALFTIVFMIPSLASSWQSPSRKGFAQCVIHCTLTAFLFGFHVHEKAILMPLVPMAILAARGNDGKINKIYLFLVALGTYSLFPLLIHSEEYGIKLIALCAYLIISLPWLRDPQYWNNLSRLGGTGTVMYPVNKSDNKTFKTDTWKKVSSNSEWLRHVGCFSIPPLDAYQTAYLSLLIPVELYTTFFHNFILKGKYPFMPLMIISVYCSIGIFWAWISLTLQYLHDLGWTR